MKATRYGIYRPTRLRYEDAIPKVTEALKAEGFGVLTTIDVAETLKNKIGVTDFPRYIILGACNPQLANQALRAEAGIGLLLPCNVVVTEEKDGSTTVAAQDPVVLFEKMVEAPGVGALAQDARARLTRALEKVASG
ncbi:MAG TPA: DUF302 domain-containing protein [Candidatus Thermoplasmatota archaeon]|nr:DUF302 domain-containing protein [Candidatus Thermoplasmatota archaeon]